MRNTLDRIARRFGYRLVKAKNLELIYQHEYAGGYEEYRAAQIHHNQRKLSSVWADKLTLGMIADDLKANGLGKTGICHGARNGFEVDWFRGELGGDIIGTDISDTAADFPNMRVWDFHDDNPEWHGSFDFAYTNSLDQAMDPEKAVVNWSRQVRPGGRIYIEHTHYHGPANASEMDPFGVHPMVMPYLLFRWGASRFRLVDIFDVDEKENKPRGLSIRAWVFVLEVG